MQTTMEVRKPLPDRRRSWTQEVTIEGHTVILTVGEYDDGTPGEVFVEILKEGTTLAGVLGTLSRLVSLSLQDSAQLSTLIHSLRGITYPPMGRVDGSRAVSECTSVTDWLASELEARYVLDGSNGRATAA